MSDDGGAVMARRWAVGGVAVLAVVPLLLGGCSSAKQASASLPSSSRTSSTTSALPPLGPSDFRLPVEARQKTPEGVKAFAGYYIELLSQSRISLASAPVRELSRDCATCTDLANSWDAAKAARETIDGGGLTLISTGSVLLHDDASEIPVYLEQAALVFRDVAGNPVPGRSSQDVKLSGGLKMVWSAAKQTWLVTQFDADPV